MLNRYCNDRWIFTHSYFQKENSNESEDCQWLARSPVTTGYDLRDSAGLKWEIWTGVIVEKELDIKDNECASSDDCNLNGECINKRCHCNKGKDGVTYLGEQCETKLKDECRVVVSEVDNSTWTSNWMGTNELFELYSRPVYTYVKGTSLLKDGMDKELGEYDGYIMSYSGLRWYGMALPRLFDDNTSTQQFWRWMVRNYVSM